MLHGVSASAVTYPELNAPAIAVGDPAHVWLIGIARAGSRLVAVGVHGVIIYSDDNGATWKQASVPVQATITTVAFATPQIGWAAGAFGLVLKTTDAGATWRTQLTGLTILQLMTQTAAQAAAANPTNEASARAVNRANRFNSEGPDKPNLSILPSSATQVTVFGAYRMCTRSTDGGNSWSDCSLSVLDPVSHNLYQVLQAPDNIYLVGEIGDVFSYNSAADQYQPLASPGDDTLFGILETKSGTLLTFGVAGAMFRSTDHGKSWTPISIAVAGDLPGGVILDNGMIVVVSANGSICVSKDDGVSFTVPPVAFGMGLFDVAEAANGDLVLVGSGGVRVVKPDTLFATG